MQGSRTTSRGRVLRTSSALAFFASLLAMSELEVAIAHLLSFYVRICLI